MVDPDDDFFVGYLPMSGRQTRFSWIVAIAIVLLVLGAGAATALFQRNPGEGLERSRSAELTGLLLDAPYPMLRVQDEDGRIRHVLLVRGGKFVYRVPPEARDTIVQLRGGLLERDGHQLMEVYGREEASVDDATLAALRAVEPEPLGEVTLAGEIVDSKCYLGRMRPGGGRTHRACAQLCIAGGIPPVLVARSSGRETHFVLSSEAGGSVAREVLDDVAVPVRVRGQLFRWADMNELRIDPSTIERP